MTLAELFDNPPAQSHSPTSQEAAAAIKPETARLRLMVLNAICNATDGLTDEEGIDLTGLQPSTYRPRRIELCQAGRVRDSGRTRSTKSGRRAIIWIAETVS